jgi:type IV pilus assembly protein PilA
MASVKTRGFTLVELLIVVAIVAILAAVAVPWVLRARMTGNEAAAISALQAINDAQSAYQVTCGRGRYAPSLSALGLPMPTTGDAFLSPDLSTMDEVVKSGYVITMTGTAAAENLEAPVNPDAWTSCNDVQTTESYTAFAEPERPGISGQRFFATNASRVIYEHSESLADAMPPTGPPPAGTELR